MAMDFKRTGKTFDYSPPSDPLLDLYNDTSRSLEDRLADMLSMALEPRAEAIAPETRAAESSLYEFVQQGWHVLEPSNEFTGGWHVPPGGGRRFHAVGGDAVWRLPPG